MPYPDSPFTNTFQSHLITTVDQENLEKTVQVINIL